MTIKLEVFDPNKFSLEKVSFKLGETTYHIGAGDSLTQEGVDFDGLGTSPLWRNCRTTQEYRLALWQDIQKSLNRYNEMVASSKYLSLKQEYCRCGEWNKRVSDELWNFRKWMFQDRFYFGQLVKMINVYRESQVLTLVHTGDLEHAELLRRCLIWLNRTLPW